MYLDVLCLLVGFLCLFVVFVMLFNRQPNHKINGYLVVILAVVGLQRFLHGIEALHFTNITYSPIKIKPVLAFYIIPIYYLFFKRLIYNTGKLSKELTQFIFPTFLVGITLFFTDFRISRFVYLGYSLLYFGFVVYEIKKFINRKNPSILDKVSYNAKKTWILIMLGLSFLLFTCTNYFVFNQLYFQEYLQVFYRYSSLVWFLVVLYMFKNPVIIFGEQSLLKTIHTSDPHDYQIWSIELLKPIEDKDLKVFKILENRINLIISEIKSLQKSTALISKTTLNADTLAKELKIPKRHLDFIFKYHCQYSINDYSNLIKVNYALTLINAGYLQKYTVDSLGKDCLFNSRFTFSKNFKKFVGVSVSNFVGVEKATSNNNFSIVS